MGAEKTRKKMVVGLSLGSDDVCLVESVVSLATKLGSDIIFVYAILPFQSYAYAGEGALYPLSSYEQSFRDFSESQGKEKLDELMELAHKLGSSNVQVSYQMSYSEPSKGIVTIAENEKADLIICGFHPEHEPSIDIFGMSISQNLFSEASIPVLAIPVDKVYHFEHMISFADDLSDASAKLFEQVYELAKTLHIQVFHHLHVNHLSLDKIDHMVEVIQNAIISGSIKSDENFDRESYLKNTEQVVLDAMRSRFDAMQTKSPSNIHHQAEISFEQTQKALKASVDRHKTDLIVFGSHHLLNKNSWTLGKIPYQAMLNLNRPVLVYTDESLSGH